MVTMDRKDEHLLESSERLQPAPIPFRLKKILVPIDFSGCSKKALQYAVPFAKHFEATLCLLYVVQINYAYGEFGALDYSLLEKQMRESGAKQLAGLAESEIGAAAPVETVIRTGTSAVREIVAAAKEGECDLIIISTHGHTGLKHVILGSTSENVVRHAPCPVLVVREQEHEFIAGGKGTA